MELDDPVIPYQLVINIIIIVNVTIIAFQDVFEMMLRVV